MTLVWHVSRPFASQPWIAIEGEIKQLLVRPPATRELLCLQFGLTQLSSRTTHQSPKDHPEQERDDHDYPDINVEIHPQESHLGSIKVLNGKKRKQKAQDYENYPAPGDAYSFFLRRLSECVCHDSPTFVDSISILS